MTLQSDLQSAILCAQQGRHNAAFKAAKSGMKKHPRHHAFPDIAGLALVAMGRERDAIGFFKKALALDPAADNTRRNLAQTLIATGQAATAVKLMKQLVAKSPSDRAAWFVLATALRETDDLSDAEAAATTVIAANPNDVSGYQLRARIREACGHLSAALQDYQLALEHAQDPVDLLIAISRLQSEQGYTEASIETARNAVAVAPENLKAQLQLAGQYLARGEIDQAIEQNHRILRIDPQHAGAIEQLAMLQEPAANEQLMKTALTAYSAAPRKSSQRASLAFALAHMALKTGEQAAADQYFSEANKDVAARTPYPASAEEQLNRKIITRFPAPFVQDGEARSATPFPIYVVGLPRSGTTLTEAILGAHPDIEPLGERRVADLLHPLIQNDVVFDAAAISRFTEQDIAELPDKAMHVRGYVDKMPENHRLIGFLATAYPNCRIVSLSRDPRDVALSLWRGHFSSGALAYSYDMKAMAHRFNLYAGIMAHWRKVFPGRILDISYEMLVSDLPRVSRTLAEYVGVGWVPEMERPDLNAGQILTLTAHQLRQPVHARSVGKWRAHRELLSLFTRALDPDLWPGID